MKEWRALGRAATMAGSLKATGAGVISFVLLWSVSTAVAEASHGGQPVRAIMSPSVNSAVPLPVLGPRLEQLAWIRQLTHLRELSQREFPLRHCRQIHAGARRRQHMGRLKSSRAVKPSVIETDLNLLEATRVIKPGLAQGKTMPSEGKVVSTVTAGALGMPITLRVNPRWICIGMPMIFVGDDSLNLTQLSVFPEAINGSTLTPVMPWSATPTTTITLTPTLAGEVEETLKAWGGMNWRA